VGKPPGTPVQGEIKKKAVNGKEWDISVPGSFRFFCVKEENDFSFSRVESTIDRSPLLLGMVRRGFISAKELGI